MNNEIFDIATRAALEKETCDLLDTNIQPTADIEINVTDTEEKDEKNRRSSIKIHQDLVKESKSSIAASIGYLAGQCEDALDVFSLLGRVKNHLEEIFDVTYDDAHDVSDSEKDIVSNYVSWILQKDFKKIYPAT